MKFNYILGIFFLIAPLGMVAEELSEPFVNEQFQEILLASKEENWDFVREASLAFISEHEDLSGFKDIYFHLGLSYYYLGDFEFCNDYLAKYLDKTTTPKHFEEALLYRFAVAEEFRAGKKLRIFKWEKAPAFLSGLEEALDIYEEIIATIPFSELAVSSLYGKACIHAYFEEYKDSVQNFQEITQKFPKHELAIEAYVQTGSLYLSQCKNEHLDPDLLDSAQSNYRKFRNAFPGEKRLEEASKLLIEIKETFASNLYETGRFYERTGKPSAAKIYYQKAVKKFSKTASAEKCQKRLSYLS